MDNIAWIRSRHYAINWADLRPLPTAPGPETNLRVDYDATGKVINMEWVNRELPSFEDLYQEFLKSRGWLDNVTTRETFEAGWDAARS